MTIAELNLKNDSDLAVVYAKAGVSVPASALARSAATAAFSLNPELREPMHVEDSECTVDPATDMCIHCSVYHGEPCWSCGGRGFHAMDCPQMIAECDEPEAHDTVYECPNCERPQQFGGLCASCTAEMRETADDPFWQRLAEAGR